MPQIIVHAEDDGRARVKAEMVKSLRTCMVETLELSEEQGQVLLYEALPINRATAADKKSMVFVEIKLVEGRTDEMKQALVDGVAEIVSDAMELKKSQVLCLFEEYPRNAYAWGK